MIAGRHAEQINLRLPTGMREALAARAVGNGRSMNSEAIQIFERALRGEQAAGDGPEKASPAAIRHSALQGAATTNG